jgi:hypothetical protein
MITCTAKGNLSIFEMKYKGHLIVIVSKPSDQSLLYKQDYSVMSIIDAENKPITHQLFDGDIDSTINPSFETICSVKTKIDRRI